MKLFRYRKPSLKTLLGLTKAERKIKKDLGIYEVTKIINAHKNLKRRILNKAGYYSEPAKILRNGSPRPGGCLVVLIVPVLMTVAYFMV
ncbi:MAG: hypothetical protein L6Q59_09440 [Ignavibacteriaceae bacterium]|nr:hypothetical protein [Ignavibacteriaceae bacterium]